MRVLGSLWLVLAACSGGFESNVPVCGTPVPLTAAEVETIIAQAFARAADDGNAYIITVANRDGVVVGSFAMVGAPLGAVDSCRRKARTAAFVSSSQHAFNTRTAGFIIEDHFPPGVPNVPGGPLYGVQFSSLDCSDIVGEISGTITVEGNGLSGDPGSMPLYRDGCLIGAVAVDGGADEADEERAAWTASSGFRPVPDIDGSLVFIDGIRLVFVDETPPDTLVIPPFPGLPGAVLVPPMAAPPDMVFPTTPYGGITVEVRSPVVPSASLTMADLDAMFDAAVARSLRTRAGIRRPLGVAARVFISIVDTGGTLLGCIRTPDATLFSFDVSVQKARTAAVFSSDIAAFTTRSLGFLAQGFYPPGIDGAPVGPLNGLQAALSATCEPASIGLANGITVFPGGVPLYKGGVLVGAIGVSGDGVDQDDFIATAGAELFPPPAGVRADELDEATAVTELRAALADIAAATADATILSAVATSDARLASNGLDGIRQPYVKFPRQPVR